jgi:hypothetical protein
LFMQTTDMVVGDMLLTDFSWTKASHLFLSYVRQITV